MELDYRRDREIRIREPWQIIFRQLEIYIYIQLEEFSVIDGNKPCKPRVAISIKLARKIIY